MRAQGNDKIFSTLLKGKSFSASLELFHWLLKVFSVDQNFLPHHWPENVENIVRRIFSIEMNRM